MGMATQHKGTAAEQGIENREEIVREDSKATHREPAEFPSSEDFNAATGQAGAAPDVPEQDDRLSDSETPNEPLHGSLHGRWTSPKETV